MKTKKRDLLKGLLFTFSKSFVLNFTLAIILMLGLVFNIFPAYVYKVWCVVLTLEVLSVDANLFF